MEENEEGIEFNRRAVKFIAMAKGKDRIDDPDKTNNSTALHNACELLTDINIIQTLIEEGSDVNSINNDNQLPLSIVLERLEKDPENEKLK